MSVFVLQPLLSVEKMPSTAKLGECFTKAFFPPKYTKTTRIKATKKILINEESIKYEVIPAQFRWEERRIKISDGTERIVTTPARYKTEYVRILISPAEKIWKRDGYKAFNSCVDSASKSGMDVQYASVGTCFYEHYQAPKYRNVSSRILLSEASERFVVSPAQYQTVFKNIVTDSTTAKLLPSKAIYKKIKDKVVLQPARTEWKKTSCENRGCQQSEVVCLVEVPKTYKEIEKRVVLKSAVAEKIAVSPVVKRIEAQEMVRPATLKRVVIPAVYKYVQQKKRIEDEKFYWTGENSAFAMSRIRSQCDKICLTETEAHYKTIAKQVLISPAQSRKIKTKPRYKIVKVKKILKPESFRKVVIPAEYRTIITEKERTKGYAKWIPMVCESNMTPSLIRRVQQALKFQGYYMGEINGVWTIASKKAVRTYQRAKGLAVGKLSIATMKSLGVD